jgi:lactate permease
VDIAAGVISMIATLIFLRFWKPKRIWRFEDEREPGAATKGLAGLAAPAQPIVPDQMDEEWDVRKLQQTAPIVKHTGGQIAKAWLPFAILSIFVLTWGLPSIKTAMGKATTPAFKTGGWEVPYLHKAVFRAQPVVAKPTAENAKFDLNWLTATGTGCFLAAIFAGIILGLRPGKMAQIFGHTLYRLRFAIIAMTCMLGLGFTTRYSGMDAVLGLAFTRTGWFFPFFGSFIGWLGVALTGSDTSSNALFGGLQKITAQQLNISPILMAATNSAGGVMGKMIDAQSICIATAATNQVGNEGTIFRFVFWHSVALAAIVGIIVMLYAYVFPQFIPSGLNFIH